MAKIPGIDSVLGGLAGVLQAQTEALIALPQAVTSLANAVQSLAEVAASAAETAQTINRLVLRVDGIVAELEAPVKALAPGVTRFAGVLDDPVLGALPDTLRRIQSDVLPVLRTLADTHDKVAFIAGSTERIMAFVDETGRTIAGIPGAALLGRRRTAAKPVPPVPPVPPNTTPPNTTPPTTPLGGTAL